MSMNSGTQISEMPEESAGGKQLTNTEHKLTEETRADQERKGKILKQGSSETKMKIRQDHKLVLKKGLQREEPLFRPRQNKVSIRKNSEFIMELKTGKDPEVVFNAYHKSDVELNVEDTSRKQSKAEFEGFDNLEDCHGDVVSGPTVSQIQWVLALLARFSSEVEEFR